MSTAISPALPSKALVEAVQLMSEWDPMDAVDDMAVPPRLTQPAPPDGWPDLPVTRTWGALVGQTIKARGWIQQQVADEIGCTQGAISQIVSGPTLTSWLVWPLCLVLDLDPPHQFYRDDRERRWVEAGRVLRRRSERAFMSALRSAEEMPGVLDDTDT